MTKDQWSYIFQQLDAGIGGTRYFSKRLKSAGIEISHVAIHYAYEKYKTEKDGFIDSLGIDEKNLNREIPRYTSVRIPPAVLAVLLISRGHLMDPDVETTARQRAREILEQEGIDPLTFCREMSFLA